MERKGLCRVLLFFLIIAGFNVNLFADGRAEPIDIFVLLDKSLSVDESCSFEGIIAWAEEQLAGQMLERGDWITIFQFYGACENLLATTIGGEADKQRVRDALAAVKPDGRFTDIGQALDVVRDALDTRQGNGRYKLLLLLTDLRQEAAWTSRYPGVIDPFTSPYLDNARVIDHGGWYEITLDMDVRDAAAELGQKIFSEMVGQRLIPREEVPEGGGLTVSGR